MQTDGGILSTSAKEEKKKANYDRILFIVDPFKAQKEEDDFKDSIAFYHPPEDIDDDSKIFLCGQIGGTYKILLNFPGSAPKFIQSQSKGYAVRKLGKTFFVSMLSRSLEMPDYTQRLLDEIHDIFIFYHHSPEYILKSCHNDWESLCSVLRSVVPLYMRFVLLRNQSHMTSAFPHIPYFMASSGKLESSVFMKAAQLLQWCKRCLNVFGGCLLYKSKVICSHLPQALCQRILILADSEDLYPHLDSALRDEHQLPVGHMFFVYVTGEELAEVSNTHRSVCGRVYRSLASYSGFRSPGGRQRRPSKRSHSGTVHKDPPPAPPQYTVIHATPTPESTPRRREAGGKDLGRRVKEEEEGEVERSQLSSGSLLVRSSPPTTASGSPVSTSVSRTGPVFVPATTTTYNSSFPDGGGQGFSLSDQLLTPVASQLSDLVPRNDVATVTPVSSDVAKDTRYFSSRSKGKWADCDDTIGYTSGEDPPFITPSSSLLGRDVAIGNRQLFAMETSVTTEEGQTESIPSDSLCVVDEVDSVSSEFRGKPSALDEKNMGISASGSKVSTSGKDSIVDLSIPGAKTIDPTTKGIDPTAEVSEPTTKVSEPTTEVSEPTTEVSESTTEPTSEVSEPTTEVSEPTTDVSEPTTEVSEPTTEVSEPTTKGSEPTTKGSVPTTKVSDSSTEESNLDSEHKLRERVHIVPEKDTTPLLELPDNDGPQLERCCVVVIKCLHTSVVLLCNKQLSENIDSLQKMWKETFQSLNDMNASVKLNKLGEDSSQSMSTHGVPASFDGIQGRVEKCPNDTTYFQRQCTKLMHSQFSHDPHLLQCTLTKTHCRMFGQRLGRHEAYLQPDRKLAQKCVAGAKVESALLFHSLPEDCAHLLHLQDKKNEYPFL